MLLRPGSDHQVVDAIDRMLLTAAGEGRDHHVQMGSRAGWPGDPATDQGAD